MSWGDVEGEMDPRRPSPLKHHHGFVPITLMFGRQSVLQPVAISPATTDAVEACISSVVEFGTLVHTARRTAHGTARRDGGRRPRYAGASDRVRTERCGGPLHDPCRHQRPAVDRDRGA